VSASNDPVDKRSAGLKALCKAIAHPPLHLHLAKGGTRPSLAMAHDKWLTLDEVEQIRRRAKARLSPLLKKSDRNDEDASSKCPLCSFLVWSIARGDGDKPMKITRQDIFVAIITGAVLLGIPTTQADQVLPPLSSAQLIEILSSPDRTAADRTNDLRRKPEQMLEFIGIRPGIVALDLSAAGGYTNELLARSIGPTGKVYGQSRPRDPNQAPTGSSVPEDNSRPNLTPVATPAPPAGARPSVVALADREARLHEAGIPAAPIVALSRPFEDPVPSNLASEQIDLVTLMFNYHDLGHLGVDRAAMNRAVFRALKPGGLFVIADHVGRPGTRISESATLHRVEEARKSKRPVSG